MAAPWIKFDTTTPDKPEVVKIAAILKIDQDAVVGKLLRLWSWVDANSVDGNAMSVTSAFIDRVTFCVGFADAMRTVGWLAGSDENLSVPNFDRHNGKTAKGRALTSRRVSDSRERNAANVANVTQGPLPNALPEVEVEVEVEEEQEQDQKKSTDVDLSTAAGDAGAGDGDLLGKVPKKQGKSVCPHMDIIALYHEILPELRAVRTWEDDRQRILRSRWNSSPDRQSLGWWRTYFTQIREMPWLMGQRAGRDGNTFQCTLEWLVRPKNFAKVIEGNYLELRR